MPRAAIIGWNNATGQIEILGSADGQKVIYTLDPNNNEHWPKLVRYLKALAPILPPGQPTFTPALPPEISQEDLDNRSIYRQPMPAAGSGVRLANKRAPTMDELDNILNEIAPPVGVSLED